MIGRFTLNLDSGYLEKDYESFLKSLRSMPGQIGYYYPHYYDEADIITSYGGLCIFNKNKDILRRIEEIKNVYGISPNYVVTNGEVNHIYFDLDKGINTSDYSKFLQILGYIYTTKKIDYIFYFDKDNLINNPLTRIYENKEKQDKLLSKLLSFYPLLMDEQAEREFNKHNLEQYKKACKLPYEEILRDFNKIEELNLIDKKFNIHILGGNIYRFVMGIKDSKSETFQYFNQNYGLNFEDEEIDLVKVKDGLLIKEGKSFFSDSLGYYTQGKDGEKVRITDFFIKVHYRLIKSPKEKVLIVSLVNEASDEKAENVERINTSNPGTFSDFLHKLGNFHFTGAKTFVTQLHKKISEVRVPEIKFVNGFGYIPEDKIIILKNGIFDIEERIWTERKEDEQFYFNYNKKGYYPSDKTGNPLLGIVGTFVPSLPTKNVTEIKEVFDFMRKLYKDNSGIFLIMMCFGILGNLMFSDKKGEFPIFFVRGITGGGKTKYTEIMHHIFGGKKLNSDFSNSTTFTMNVTLSYLKGLPYFLSEYREGAKDKDNKVGMLRSNYDGSGNTKGRADQTIVKYDYEAIPVIDGEEMITDGAVRTRSIQMQLIKKHRIDGNFEDIYSNGKQVLDGLMYTYLNFADKEKYFKYKKEGFGLFTSTEARIKQNLSSIYAGCMAISEEHKDLYLDILKDVLKFQNTDHSQNSTTQQIVKAITKYLEDDYENIGGIYDITSKNTVVINRNKFEMFILKKKIYLSLKIETYKEHIESLGYEIDYFDDGESLKYGIIIPYDKIIKDFLVNPVFYNADKFLRTGKRTAFYSNKLI